MTALLAGASAAVRALTDGGGADAARAIMTTDTVPKTAVVRDAGGWSVGGMAKGAGMLAPGLATMLVVLTTDAVVPPAELDAALRSATRTTLDRVDTDGCMSTNDTVLLLGSGASGVVPGAAAFGAAVHEVCARLAAALVADAEGASHDIAIEIVGAASRGRRRRGRPVGRPQQPVQGGRLRQGPELGQGPRRRRHDPGGVRPGHPRCDDQRRRRLPGVRRRGGPGPRRPVRTRGCTSSSTSTPGRTPPRSGPTTSPTTTSTRTAPTRRERRDGQRPERTHEHGYDQG